MMDMYLVIRQYQNYDGAHDVDILSLHDSREGAERAAAQENAAKHTSPASVMEMTVNQNGGNGGVHIPLIVTRHAGAVAWLEGEGITGEVVAHATQDDVGGRVVVGALPLHLAAEAAQVWAIDMPNLRPEQRGQDLTPAEMRAAGATIRRYVVREAA